MHQDVIKGKQYYQDDNHRASEDLNNSHYTVGVLSNMYDFLKEFYIYNIYIN